MKTLQRNPRNSINRSFACIPQRSSLLLLVTANILLTSVNVFGTTNHPPAVSWIKDQALSDQQGQQDSFETVYFRAWDSEALSVRPQLQSNITQVARIF